MSWLSTGIKSGGNLSTAIRKADNLDDNFFKSLKLDFSADWLKNIKYNDFDDDFVKLLAKNVSTSQLANISPENLVHMSKKLEGDKLTDFTRKLDSDTQEKLFKQLDANGDYVFAKKLGNSFENTDDLNKLMRKFPDGSEMKKALKGAKKTVNKNADAAKKLSKSQIKDRNSLTKAASSEFADPKNTEIMEKGAKYQGSVNQENIQRYADDLGDSELAKNLSKRNDTVNIYNSKPMKSSMKKIGLVGIGALVGVMIMYGEANPFKAIRKAGEDLGKVMRVAKDAAISTAKAAGDTVGGLAKLISWITKNAHIPIVGSIICVVLMLAMYAYSSFSK
tara:strand:+ start:3071 stop:4075 length:1005 start_codon:yes stop_codon:yes gene_type:complete